MDPDRSFVDRRIRTLILLLLLAVYLPEAVTSLVESLPRLVAFTYLLHFFYFVESPWEIIRWFFTGVGDLVPLAAIVAAGLRPSLLRPALLVIGTYAVLDAVLGPLAQLFEMSPSPSVATAWGQCAIQCVTEASKATFPWVFHALLRSHSRRGTAPKVLGAALTRWFIVLFGIRYLSTIGWAAWYIVLAFVLARPPGLLAGLAYCLGTAASGAVLVFAGVRLVRHRRISRTALRWTFLILAIDLLISFGFGVYWTVAWQYLGMWVWLGAGAAAVGITIATLSWYWWPILRRRESAALDDTPTCTVCGYNLTGNTSGRCPECGAAVATPQLAST